MSGEEKVVKYKQAIPLIDKRMDFEVVFFINENIQYLFMFFLEFTQR